LQIPELAGRLAALSITMRIINMKSLAGIFIAIAISTVLVSCSTTPIDMDKVLELKPGQKVYTSHNIWYENRDEISQMNYHKGKIIPFGTEVRIIEATRGGIAFQDVNTGETYKMDFVRKILVSRIEHYIRLLFTVNDAEKLASGIKPEILEKIKAGTVEKGMTKKEVIIAYGYPPHHRTPSINEDTWIYFDDVNRKKRVIFSKKGLVLEIMRD
jgi:hypothetical protein